MISLKQLQQLRELVHRAVERLRLLEQENAQMRQMLLQYKGNLDGLSQENQALEKNRQLVESEVSGLLDELQSLHLNDPDPGENTASDNVDSTDAASETKAGELPQVSPDESLQFVEQRQSVDPKHISEHDYEQFLRQSGQLNGVSETVTQEEPPIKMPANQQPPNYSVPAEPVSSDSTGTEQEELSHSLDVSLGMGGDSLLALEENLSSPVSGEDPTEDNDLEIF
ncbi:cell division protein ZapB [Candidatus Haliotispira prima]|uniref:Cell division protein ZapB n=1 Tax=Candidatus Haliotispira prima TaxID=3034016 RepID=A0ABY8MI01_9SPIO|nr:cell division protein ZapB [Candidatus Haliotispira prima]